MKLLDEMMKSGKREDYEKMAKLFGESLEKMKEYNPQAYEEMEEAIYCMVHGYHFNEHNYRKALDGMINEDGTRGAHWTLDETNQVLRKFGIRMTDDYNEYDFCYAMNMMYSDHYATAKKFNVNTVDFYVELALDFLEDEDGISGIAYKHYLMKKED